MTWVLYLRGGEGVYRGTVREGRRHVHCACARARRCGRLGGRLEEGRTGRREGGGEAILRGSGATPIARTCACVAGTGATPTSLVSPSASLHCHNATYQGQQWQQREPHGSHQYLCVGFVSSFDRVLVHGKCREIINKKKQKRKPHKKCRDDYSATVLFE